MERRSTFAEQLRTELNRRGLGVRTLARMIAPENVNSTRVLIHKWLREEHSPSAASRVAVARALGLPPEFFLDDDDDEEEESLPALLQKLASHPDMRPFAMALYAEVSR